MNRKGYKHTSLGWIPEDWEVKKIRDFGKISSGTTPLRAIADYFLNGQIHWVKTTDLNNSIIFETEEKVTEKALAETSLRIYPKGTVLVAMYGGFNQIGRTGLLGVDATINQALSAITVDSRKIDRLFLLNWLNANVGLWKNFAGSSRKDPNITSNDVGDFPFIEMSLFEQQGISAVLSSWDTAIDKEQRLIHALEIRHRGLMQQLLGGKRRLKGFEGKWKIFQIADIANEISVRNKDDKEIIVLSCTKYDGLVSSLEYFGRKKFSDDLTSYKLVPKKHFAYATNHIEEGSIGYQESYDEGLISPMYTVFRTDDNLVSDHFLLRLLKTHRYILEYRRRMEGSIDRRGGLRWDDFSKIKVHLPSLDEQRAIASVLDDSDEEIQLHRKRLAVLQRQKMGLMQVLLTGKVRVSPKEE